LTKPPGISICSGEPNVFSPSAEVSTTIPLKHLDEPESEYADVLRGLRTRVSAGAKNPRRFVEPYGKVLAGWKMLEEGVAKWLAEGM
jgi:hypothetical protein